MESKIMWLVLVDTDGMMRPSYDTAVGVFDTREEAQDYVGNNTEPVGQGFGEPIFSYCGGYDYKIVKVTYGGDVK